MRDTDPARRLVDRMRSQPDDSDHAGVLVSIPLVYAAGAAVWWSLDLQLSLVMIGSSLLACVVLVEALFLNPPVP